MAIATRTADPDAPFTLASLVGEAGVGANGEKLVNTLAHYYPPELEAATLKRVNPKLNDQLTDEAIASIAKLAGAPAGSDLNVKVRGGHRRDSDAVVVYAYHDESGQLWKGCFPYEDVGKTSSAGHVAQRDSLANSPEAEGYAKAQAKARAAANPEAKALRERVAELEAELDKAPAEADPVEGYSSATARDIVTQLAEAPRDVAERVRAFEASHDDRSTVLAAADKRLAALDADDQAAAERAAAKDAELETLRKRVAELEQPAAGS